MTRLGIQQLRHAPGQAVPLEPLLSEATQPNPALPAPDLLGQQIGDYRLLRRIGRGGMADVYLADQLSLRRQVALKILRADLVADAGYVQRFEREAQAAAALVQSNIVQIYEVGQKDNIHYIAQEYVPGRNLRQFINRFGAVQPAMALSVLRQVGAALQKAGELGVIHRDIKPENIMLSPGGEVKVADFGLARVTGTGQGNDLTQIGIAMGTPLYMSPEQVEGLPVDPRSDLYSLGVTAWHMLAGYPPFEGANALAVALQHVRQDPEPLERIRPDLPAELCQIVRQLMAKKPEDRIQSAPDLLRELRKVQIDLDGEIDSLATKLAETRPQFAGIGSTTATEPRLEATRQLQELMQGHDVQRSFWRRVLLAAALLGLLGAAGGAALAWLSPPRNPLDEVAAIDPNEVPREATIEEQYRAAIRSLDSPAHYLAVEQYFPPESAAAGERHTNLLHNRKAWLELGKLYLKTEQIARAKACFERLATADEYALYFQISGKAGLAIIAEYEFDIPLVQKLLLEIDESLDAEENLIDGVQLLDDYLREKLIPVIERHGQDIPGFGLFQFIAPAKRESDTTCRPHGQSIPAPAPGQPLWIIRIRSSG
jgi:eukaryotic-like serine/threonine-protein kinase